VRLLAVPNRKFLAKSDNLQSEAATRNRNGRTHASTANATTILNLILRKDATILLPALANASP
jgi:hypothetical protein